MKWCGPRADLGSPLGRNGAWLTRPAISGAERLPARPESFTSREFLHAADFPNGPFSRLEQQIADLVRSRCGRGRRATAGASA